MTSGSKTPPSKDQPRKSAEDETRIALFEKYSGTGPSEEKSNPTVFQPRPATNNKKITPKKAQPIPKQHSEDKTVVVNKIAKKNQKIPKTGSTVHKLPLQKLPVQKLPVQKKPPVEAKKKAAGKNQAEALTEIRQSIFRQDNSQGFIKAKKAADKALASNKIVLNKRFVLEKTVGAGGMGTVYIAKDLRKVEANDRNPYVAVKVLNEDFKNHPDAFVTLQREASRSHHLSHPNIVNVHDFDRDNDIIYMTMELLQGQPLDKIFRQTLDKGTPFEKAEPIINDICDALTFAHNKNIIHSDLKPGNIFITRDGAKILDFGIARLTSNTDDFDSGSLGAITPAYASLEMIKGEPPHPSDDLYAIAIIVYEFLSGHHPFNRAPADLAFRKNLKPKKIPGLSKRQWLALEGALQKTREKRTTSVKEFQQDFLVKRKFPIFKITSAILLLISTALVYSYLFVLDDVGAIIEQAFESGNQCVKSHNYQCAIEKFETVLELSPDHHQAKQHLAHVRQLYQEESLKSLSIEIQDCLNKKQDLVCATAKLQEMKKFGSSLDEIIKAQKDIDDFKTNSQIDLYMIAANDCYTKEDFDCALDKIGKVFALTYDYPQALSLRQEIVALQKQQQADFTEKNRKFDLAIAEGQRCLSSEDFDCAIEYFETAITIKPSNPEVKTFYQHAVFAKQRYEEAYDKANKLLTKAETCLANLNYTCTISNAESALEFVPQYDKAIQLKQQALEEQQAAKGSLIIK